MVVKPGVLGVCLERNWILHYFVPPSNRALWCRSTLVLHNYTVSFSPLSYLNWILFGAYRNCYTSSSSLFPTLFRFSLFSTWSGTALALFKLSGFWDSHELRHITMSIFKCFILLKFIILFVNILLPLKVKISMILGIMKISFQIYIFQIPIKVNEANGMPSFAL